MSTNTQSPTSSLDDFIAKAEFLPPVPHVMAKVNEFLNDSNSSIDDFEAVISQDQVISAKLLRLVNSSFYGFHNTVETIGQAISMVGYKQMSDIVVGLSITQMFNKSPEIDFDLEAFWKHSLACGVAARVLAMYGGANDTETYFTAGLLHDIGRMLFVYNDAKAYAEVLKKNSTQRKETYLCERDFYGFDHADLGGFLTRDWKFPDRLQEAVRCHHNPQAAHSAGTMTATIHLANFMVHACQIGASGDCLIPRFDRDAWNHVGLNAAILVPASDRTLRQFSELEEAIMK